MEVSKNRSLKGQYVPIWQYTEKEHLLIHSVLEYSASEYVTTMQLHLDNLISTTFEAARVINLSFSS